MWKSKKLEPIVNPPLKPQFNILDKPHQNNFAGPRLTPRQLQLPRVDEHAELDGQPRDNNFYTDKNRCRRNILDGSIRREEINYLDKGYPTDYLQDYRDDDVDYLLKPDIQKKMCYLENLKEGTFININEKTMQHILSDKSTADSSMQSRDQFGQELFSVISSINLLTLKAIYFIEGMLFGYCIMHAMMLYIDQDIQQTLTNYSKYGIRLYQLIHIGCFIACFGQLHICIQTKQQLTIAQNKQMLILMEAKASLVKSILAFILFAIAYIIVICLHPDVAKISDNYNEIKAGSTTYVSNLRTYRGFLIAVTIITGIGWLISISNSKSIIDFNLYEDDDFDEDIDNSDANKNK